MKLPFGLTRLMALLVISLALVGLAACGDDEETTGGTTGGAFDGTIKIAQIADDTGIAGGSPITASFKPGMEAAIRQINAAGGVKVGGKSYQFELINRDARSDPTVALASAREMLDQKVLFVSLATFVWFDFAYQQLKDSAITFMVLPQGLTLLQFEGAQAHPLLFSPVEMVLPILTGWAKEMKGVFPNIKRYGYLAEDNPLSRAVELAMAQTAKDAGLEYVGPEFAPLGSVDWSVQITNLKAKTPDLVYVLGGANASQVVKQAVDQGLATYLQIPGFRPEDIGAVGNLRNTTIISVDFRQPLYRNATPNNLVKDVQSLGTLPGGANLQTGFAISYYDWLHLLKQAIEKAGTVTDVKLIAQAMPGQTYEGPFGTAVANPNHSTSGPTGIIAATASDWKVFVFDKVGDTTPSQTFTFKTADVLKP